MTEYQIIAIVKMTIHTETQIQALRAFLEYFPKESEVLFKEVIEMRESVFDDDADFEED